MVGGGGEAKIVISEGYVFVNGEVEFQKRKKVYQDDIIEFNGEVIQVNVVKNQVTDTANQNSNLNPVKTKKPKPKATKKQAAKTPNTTSENLQIEQPRSKRKPISF